MHFLFWYASSFFIFSNSWSPHSSELERGQRHCLDVYVACACRGELVYVCVCVFLRKGLTFSVCVCVFGSLDCWVWPRGGGVDGRDA